MNVDRLNRIIKHMQSGSLSTAKFQSGSLEEKEFGDINRFLQGVNLRTYGNHLLRGFGRIRGIGEDQEVRISSVPLSPPKSYFTITVGASATKANLHGTYFWLPHIESLNPAIDGYKTFTFDQAVLNVSGTTINKIGLLNANTPHDISARIIESINNDHFHGVTPFRLTATDDSGAAAAGAPHAIRFDFDKPGWPPLERGRNARWWHNKGAISRLLQITGSTNSRFRRYASEGVVLNRAYVEFNEYEWVIGQKSELVTKSPNHFNDQRVPVFPISEADVYSFTGSMDFTGGRYLARDGQQLIHPHPDIDPYVLPMLILSERENILFVFSSHIKDQTPGNNYVSDRKRPRITKIRLLQEALFCGAEHYNRCYAEWNGIERLNIRYNYEDIAEASLLAKAYVDRTNSPEWKHLMRDDTPFYQIDVQLPAAGTGADLGLNVQRMAGKVSSTINRIMGMNHPLTSSMPINARKGGPTQTRPNYPLGRVKLTTTGKGAFAGYGRQILTMSAVPASDSSNSNLYLQGSTAEMTIGHGNIHYNNPGHVTAATVAAGLNGKFLGLTSSDGTTMQYVFDTSVAVNASANKIGLSGVSYVKDIANRIKDTINNTATHAASAGTDPKISCTYAFSSLGSNDDTMRILCLHQDATGFAGNKPVFLSPSTNQKHLTVTNFVAPTLNIQQFSGKFGRVTGSIATLGSVAAMLRLEGKLNGEKQFQVVPGFAHVETFGQSTPESDDQDGKPYADKDGHLQVVIRYLSKSLNDPDLTRVTHAGIIHGSILNPFTSASNGRIDTGVSLMQIKAANQYDALAPNVVGSIYRPSALSSNILMHQSSLWPVHTASSGLLHRNQLMRCYRVSAGFSINGGFNQGTGRYDQFSSVVVSDQIDNAHNHEQDPFIDKPVFINDPKQFTLKHYVVGKSIVVNPTSSRGTFLAIAEGGGTAGAMDVTRLSHGIVDKSPFVDNHDAEIIYDMPLSHPRKTLTVGSGGTFQELLFSGTLSASLSMNSDLRLNHRFTTSGFVYGKTDTGRDSISFGGLDRDG